MSDKLTVTARVEADIQKVWELWNNPDHITHWYFASDDWHCPHAEADFTPGGQFIYRLEAKDGSMGFDYTGHYSEIHEHQKVGFELDDQRQVEVNFSVKGRSVEITEIFEADTSASLELQQDGWQAILDQFAGYVSRQPS
jgi:uncharacterized protein YndB with AHSA1/START domain